MNKSIGYKLSQSSEKGEGIYATEEFHENDVVMIGEFQKMDLDKNHSHASQIGESQFAFHGGLISKVNHSCSPNCGIQVNATGAHDFVAMKTIEVGDEITFDYAMRNYYIEYFPMQCCCGSETCRGSITGWKDLPESFKLDYVGFVAPYLIEMDIKRQTETVG